MVYRELWRSSLDSRSMSSIKEGWRNWENEGIYSSESQRTTPRVNRSWIIGECRIVIWQPIPLALLNKWIKFIGDSQSEALILPRAGLSPGNKAFTWQNTSRSLIWSKQGSRLAVKRGVSWTQSPSANITDTAGNGKSLNVEDMSLWPSVEAAEMSLNSIIGQEVLWRRPLQNRTDRLPLS